MHDSVSATPHSVKNWPSVFAVWTRDSVWRMPVESWVWSGEMHGTAHIVMPPYPIPRGSLNVFTSGSLVLIPMPAGTTTGVPSTNTSRWVWTWFVPYSLGPGCRPAATVRASGSGGAAHRITAAGAGGALDGGARVAGGFDAMLAGASDTMLAGAFDGGLGGDGAAAAQPDSATTAPTVIATRRKRVGVVISVPLLNLTIRASYGRTAASPESAHRCARRR